MAKTFLGLASIGAEPTEVSTSLIVSFQAPQLRIMFPLALVFV